MGRLLRNGALLGVAGLALALLLGGSGALEPLERATWGWRVAHFARGPVGPDPIVLIALDQQSLDWGRRENGLSWPWPREAYGLILDFCHRAGAKAVALDLLFTEASLYGVDDDRALAEALRRAGVTVGSAALGSGSAASWPQRTGRIDWPIALADPTTDSPSAGLPVPQLSAAFSLLGSVSASPDPDGVFRAAPLLARLNGEPVPSLSLALYLAAHPQGQISAAADGWRIDSRPIPVAVNGYVLPRYRGASATFPTLSAAAVIQSELLLQEAQAPSVDPQLLRGAYVIVGLTAPGLYDLRPTPVDGVFPGMEVHATLLDNLQSGQFLRPVPGWTVAAWSAVLALLAGLLVVRCRNATQSVLLLLIAVPLPLAAGFFAYDGGLALPIATPATAAALTLFAGVLFNYATEGRKKRAVRRAFNQYLHPTVIEQLVENPERLRLGGEKRTISIFFSDLEGFTGLSERLDPEQLTAFLNHYLTEMTDIILEAGGTIDKYEGDAIIAFWNAPLDQPDHAERAVRAALACQARLAELAPQLQEHFGVAPVMRIGINTGAAVVGNMGSTRRFDYTMLGDAVNLASRLEGVNKVFATRVLISEATATAIGDALPLREIATVAVVGRREPVRIFRPLQQPEASDDAFAVALAAFRRGAFAEAARQFEALAADDATAMVYARRCCKLDEESPADWDGVWELQQK